MKIYFSILITKLLSFRFYTMKLQPAGESSSKPQGNRNLRRILQVYTILYYYTYYSNVANTTANILVERTRYK